MTELSLLVIEDDQGLGGLIEKILRREGFATECVADGESALVRIAEGRFDLALLDHHLPDISGLELLQRLEQSGRSINFVAMTGYGDEALAVSFMKAGAREYLIKDSEFLESLPATILRVARQIETEKKLQDAEKARVRSEALLRATVDGLPDQIALLDPTGEIALVNKSWREFARGSETCCRKITKGNYILHCESIDCKRQALARELAMGARQVLSGERDDFEVVYSCELQNETRWYQARVTPFEWLESRMAVVAHTDITQRKLSERAREPLLSAIQQTADAVVITDTTGAIQYVNPAFEKISGYTYEEVKGQNPRILKSGKQGPEVYEDLWRALSQGKTWRGQMINRAKDGALFTEVSTITPVRDPMGEIVHYVAVKRDITSTLRLEEQLRQAQRLEALGRSTAGVATDFDSILRSITAAAEQATNTLAIGHPARQSLDNILNTGQRGSQLVNRLRIFSRQGDIRLRNMNLNKIIETIREIIQRALDSNIVVDWKLDRSIGLIHADASMIERALINLCTNAREAIAPHEGRVTISTRSERLDDAFVEDNPWAELGKFVVLSVLDNGRGMGETTRQRAFEPFFTTKTAGEGSGMGLAMVYGMMREHNGFTHLSSELGAGACVELYFPEIQMDVEDTPTPRFDGGLPGGAETILLAKRDTPIREMTRGIMEMAGYRVLEADSGAGALAIAESHDGPIDMAVIDLIMPNMGGMKSTNPCDPITRKSRRYSSAGLATPMTPSRSKAPVFVSWLSLTPSRIF